MWVRRLALITCLSAALAALPVGLAAGVSGDLDTGFDNDSKRVIDFGGQQDFATAVLVRGDGKIVLVGGGQPPGASEQEFVVTRLDPDGSTDTTGGTLGL